MSCSAQIGRWLQLYPHVSTVCNRTAQAAVLFLFRGAGAIHDDLRLVLELLGHPTGLVWCDNL